MQCSVMIVCEICLMVWWSLVFDMTQSSFQFCCLHSLVPHFCLTDQSPLFNGRLVHSLLSTLEMAYNEAQFCVYILVPFVCMSLEEGHLLAAESFRIYFTQSLATVNQRVYQWFLIQYMENLFSIQMKFILSASKRFCFP